MGVSWCCSRLVWFHPYMCLFSVRKLLLLLVSVVFVCCISVTIPGRKEVVAVCLLVWVLPVLSMGRFSYIILVSKVNLWARFLCTLGMQGTSSNILIFLLLKAVDCGPLTNPANGQVSHTGGTTFGKRATYSCNTGYRLVGHSDLSSYRTCQATGRWYGSEPTCQGKIYYVVAYKLIWLCTKH